MINTYENKIQEIKQWFCSKNDSELAEFITKNNSDSIFMRSLPSSMVDDWKTTVQLLSNKRIIIPLGERFSRKMIDELHIRYQRFSKLEYQRIRDEFSNYLENQLS